VQRCRRSTGNCSASHYGSSRLRCSPWP
jgi:hypothetical protein